MFSVDRFLLLYQGLQLQIMLIFNTSLLSGAA